MSRSDLASHPANEQQPLRQQLSGSLADAQYDDELSSLRVQHLHDRDDVRHVPRALASLDRDVLELRLPALRLHLPLPAWAFHDHAQQG